MKSHNKFLVLTLTALIALSTVACSNKKEAPGASEASSSTEPVITTKETPVETLPVKPDNKDAIEKINAIDVPENIKKIFTDKGRFIDTTQHGKVTTLENFQYGDNYETQYIDTIDSVLAADIDGDGINELIFATPAGKETFILHTDNTYNKVTLYNPYTSRFIVAEKGTMQFSGGANYNLYYKITFTDTEMLEDYIGGERDGIYTQKEEVSKDEYDKFLESYPLYNMDDCFTELSYVVDNGTISGNKDAIDKINTLDIPDGIKKVFTTHARFIDTTSNGKSTTLKDFKLYSDNKEYPIDLIAGVYTADIDNNGTNELICSIPTYHKNIVFLTNSSDNVFVCDLGAENFTLAENQAVLFSEDSGSNTYYKVVFSEYSGTYKSYLAGENNGVYTIDKEVSREDFDKLQAGYPLLSMPFITIDFTVERLSVKPDNKEAIAKINALDVPENIKKVFTDKGEFIDTTHHGKVTTLEDFRYFHTDGEKALDYIDGIYTADIDGDEINELICILPTYLTELILHTDDVSGKVTAYIPNSTRFQVAEKGTILGSSGAEANSYYKVTFTDDEMHEDYLGSEYWGTYKIKTKVSKEEYDKFIEPYPLYKMEDCFTELSFTINNGTASNNSDAITKINALDIPENIKKIFTDNGQFIDTTHNEKTTTLKNFQIYYDNEERPIDAVNGIYAIDIDRDGINDLICKVPTYNKSIVFLTNSEDEVFVCDLGSENFTVASNSVILFNEGTGVNTYYKVSFSRFSGMGKSYLAGEKNGIYTIDKEVSKEDYEKLQAEYPLYNMSELHSDIKFTI